MHTLTGFESILSELQFIVLFLLIAAYNSSWGNGPYPTWPQGCSAWAYRIVWGLLTNGLAVAVFGFYYVANKVDEDPALQNTTFNLDHAALYNWTWILIIVHFVHVKLLGIYNNARHLGAEKIVSNILFVLTILAGIALSIMCFYQHAWLAAVGFTAHTFFLLIIVAAFLSKYDFKAMKVMEKRQDLQARFRTFSGQKPVKP